MIYAITSTGSSKDDRVDVRFGRCRFVVTYDTETMALGFLPNPFLSDDDDVGPRLVDLLTEKQVGRIVSGSFGIRIKPLLDSRKIQMIIPGDPVLTVGEVVEIIQSAFPAQHPPGG